MMPSRKTVGATLLLWLCSNISSSLAMPSATGPCRLVPETDTTDEVRLTGELTQKGSDTDAWWALRTESGTVYRLQLKQKHVEKSFLNWQNRSVSIIGTPSGKILAVDVICVREASLVKP